MNRKIIGGIIGLTCPIFAFWLTGITMFPLGYAIIPISVLLNVMFFPMYMEIAKGES